MAEENAQDPPVHPSPLRDLAQVTTTLKFATQGPGFTDITPRVAAFIDEINAAQGLLTAFIAHTSASLTIQENADPAVQQDLLDALAKLAPEQGPYRHDAEGADDMPAHIKAMLTSVSLSIPVVEKRMALGTWQGIFVIEHRAKPQNRRVELTFIGSIGAP
jgi:secondary thiamine-phosphate synthase enzyme